MQTCSWHIAGILTPVTGCVTARDLRYAVLRMVYNGFQPKADDEEDTGMSFYPCAALMSHSCDPILTRWDCPPGSDSELGHEYRVNRDLPAGSELTWSYLSFEDLYEHTQNRKTRCRNWHMDCACVRCSAEVDTARGIVCASSGEITFWAPARGKFQDFPSGRAVTIAEQARFFEAETAAEVAAGDAGPQGRASLAKAIDAARRGGVGQSGFLARLLEKAAKAAKEERDTAEAEVLAAEAKEIFEQILPFGTPDLADIALFLAEAAVANRSADAVEICEEALELAEAFYTDESEQYHKLSALLYRLR